VSQRGYAKILKSIRQSAIWCAREVSPFQAYIDLCLMADDQLPVRIGRVLKMPERGVVWVSQRYLEVRWGKPWDRSRVRRFLDSLEETGMATVATDGECTRIEPHYLDVVGVVRDPLVGPVEDPLCDPQSGPGGGPKRKTQTQTQPKPNHEREVGRDLTADENRSGPSAAAKFFGAQRIVWIEPERLQMLIRKWGRRNVERIIGDIVDWAQVDSTHRSEDWASTAQRWLKREKCRPVEKVTQVAAQVETQGGSEVGGSFLTQVETQVAAHKVEVGGDDKALALTRAFLNGEAHEH